LALHLVVFQMAMKSPGEWLQLMLWGLDQARDSFLMQKRLKMMPH
jgi:hypothetical protein